MLKIYLDHGMAHGNLGDEAMLINAARRIRERLGGVEFVIPCEENAPLPDIGLVTKIPPPQKAIFYTFEWLKKFKIFHRFPFFWSHDRNFRLSCFLLRHLFRWKEWSILANQLKSCDAVYFVGAANLNDIGRRDCLYPRLLLALEASRQNCPVVISSQTVGPLRYPWTLSALKKLVKNAKYFSIRDGGSSRLFLKRAGISDLRVPFVGDEAFTLPCAEETMVKNYLLTNGVDLTKPYIVVHFRGTDYTGTTENGCSVLARLLNEINFDAQICFLPMSYWSHSGLDEDTGKLIKQLMGLDKLIVLPTIKDAQLAKGVVSLASGVIALSYHVQVFALWAGVPFLILTSGDYYQVKSSGMSMLLKNQVSVIDLKSDFSLNRAKHLICKWLEERESQKILLRAVRVEILKVNDGPINALVEAIKEKNENKNR